MVSLVQMVVKYLVPRKVAVDASMSLYQFLIAVRQVGSGLEGTGQICGLNCWARLLYGFSTGVETSKDLTQHRLIL